MKTVVFRENLRRCNKTFLAGICLTIIAALTLLTITHPRHTGPSDTQPAAHNNHDHRTPTLSRDQTNILLREQLLLATKLVPRNLRIQTSRSYLTIHPLDGSAGRLGNFLFRYAAALEIAERHNMTLVLPDTELVTSMREQFHITAPTENELHIKPTYMEVNEKSWGIFDPNLFSLPGSNNIRLELSYTQSFKYFNGIQDRIHREFTIKSPHENKSKSRVRSLKETHKAIAVIGLHVRRGDFLKPSFDEFGYTVAPKQFFTNAINYFVEKYGNQIIFLIASDDHDWCLKNLEFGTTQHFYGVNQTAMEDFSMLVHCDHHIVSVGSFGWWAAWLGIGEVVYYKNWPRPGSPHSKNHSPQDYYPAHWIALI